MLNAEVLTFREFVTHEPLPLSTIQGAVLEFLQGRGDAALFGAQAVNAYVSEPRATGDVYILATHAPDLAQELREYICERFHIAIRIREVGEKGLRLYQVRKEGNRHLVDLRNVDILPSTETIENVKVLAPIDLIVSKVLSYHARRGQPKSGTDWRDIGELLLRFPDAKKNVVERLRSEEVGEAVLKTWGQIAKEDFRAQDEDDDLTSE
jgi:hypothetical protein